MISQLSDWYLLEKTSPESSENVVPSEFSRCQVSVICQSVLNEVWSHSSNYVTDGKPFEVCVGKASTPFNMIIDHCLFQLKVGEICKLLLKADGGSFNDLTDVEKSECIQDLSEHASAQDMGDLAQSPMILIQDQVDFSFLLFSRALKYTVCVGNGTDPDIPEDLRLIKIQCYLNLAACHLQKEAYSFVLHNCTKALDLDQYNIKGLYRRAQAYVKTGNFESAQSDLEKALQREPNNKLLQNLQKDVQQKCHEQHQTLSSAMSKMFN
ncbi:hypothetical protein LSH36_49g06063 [Paralvinella palmiformis]|uniref:BDBT FKBP like N-terminal domain-containing protein n=1 Tax=Paralvinella palmiformis TaxID=53620 RepID=A0AAD9K7M6_9ANNE|nr:hypothetical protein LSH36_49g06063 [Paralvinella palmiformis]